MTGWPPGARHVSIAVTTGLLATMSRDGLQGVVAHEVAPVRNYDIRKMMGGRAAGRGAPAE